jgi:hypothetical protein
MKKNKYFILENEFSNEALILKRDKENKKLIVFSDLENERAASGETFKNKDKLKNAGFKWDNNNKAWTIGDDELMKAISTLNTINKSEKFIDKLEDIEEAIASSDVPNKTSLNDRIKLFVDDLANATDEAAADAKIKQYLNFFGKLRKRSFTNTFLIFIQNPDATHVEGYRTWQTKFHRYVKKGAKGITIFAPVTSKKSDELTDGDPGLDAEVKKKSIVTFKPATVFDVADTEPIDEKGELPEEPKWFDENSPSETADELYGYVEILLQELGINLTTLDAKGGEKGFSAGDHINLTSDVKGVGRLSTLIHELAHELMHWKKTSPFYDEENIGSNNSRALQELQAESVSYTVLRHYNIPVQHHATYLALWRANKDSIKNNLDTILKVSEFIISRIDRIVSEEKKNSPETGEELQEIRKMISKLIRENFSK